jgi:hypothetical protein
MEDLIEIRYSNSSSRSRSRSPERQESILPERRKSPVRLLPLTVLAADVVVKKDTMEVEIEMNDTEFISLKNSEKRSYNKRMRERQLLAEKHLLNLTQELLGQV